MKKLLIVIALLLLPSCAHYNPRPWTTGEKTALAWSCVASVADMYTTHRFLDNPNNWETNPMLGERPSDGEVIMFLGVSQLITIGLSHYFPDLRIPLLCVKGSLNTINTIGNTQLEW